MLMQTHIHHVHFYFLLMRIHYFKDMRMSILMAAAFHDLRLRHFVRSCYIDGCRLFGRYDEIPDRQNFRFRHEIPVLA